MTYNLPNIILFALFLTFSLYAVNIARLSYEYNERQLKALHTPTQSVIIRETVCDESEVIKDIWDLPAVSEEEYNLLMDI